MSGTTDAVSRRERGPVVVPRIVAGMRLRRRHRGARGDRRLARSTGPGRSCSWSASPRGRRGASPRSPGGDAGAAGWSRRALAVAFLAARRPARRAVATGRARRRPARGLAELASGAVWPGRTSSRSTCPSGRTATCWFPRSWCSWSGRACLLLLSWREDRVAYAAVPVAIGMCRSGSSSGAHGQRAAGDRPVCLYAPVETALGLAALLACLMWLRGGRTRSGSSRCSGPPHPAACACRGVPRGPTVAARRSARHGGGRARRRGGGGAVRRPRRRARRAALGGRPRDRPRRGGRARCPSTARLFANDVPTTCSSLSTRGGPP